MHVLICVLHSGTLQIGSHRSAAPRLYRKHFDIIGMSTGGAYAWRYFSCFSTYAAECLGPWTLDTTNKCSSIFIQSFIFVLVLIVLKQLSTSVM